ncbi:MAG: YqgE/AlgH family protein [Bacteroidales bacterium]|nr:YqgE/AlgH family protein [Bacteroidales bacterium]
MDIEKLLVIKKNELAPGKGRLLISEPFMDDFYFGRSVILLISHDSDGSFGLIMNKPVPEKFNDIIADFPPFDAHVFIGGPVQPDNMFILHTLGDRVEGSVEIIEGLYWGGDLEAIREQILLGTVNPNEVRFFMGYSGWESEQLNNELERNAWVVTKTTTGKLLRTKHNRMWSQFVSQLGSEYELWNRFPVNPEMN